MQDDIGTAQPKGSGGVVNAGATPPHSEAANNLAFSPTAQAAAAPPQSLSEPALSAVSDDKPVPVVKVLSVRGMEYLFMTITLFFCASSLVTILLAVVNSQASFDALSYPTSLLLVSLPIFAFFFLRLRRAELKDPTLRLEASKRRASQFSQLVSFLVCVFTVVTLVSLVMGSLGGSYDGSLGKAFLNGAVVLLVAGGVFMYYWFDEHKLVK